MEHTKNAFVLINTYQGILLKAIDVLRSGDPPGTSDQQVSVLFILPWLLEESFDNTSSLKVKQIVDFRSNVSLDN